MKILLLAFRGTGKFDKNIDRLPTLVIAGHAGIKFEDDPIIYGFHPTSEAEITAGSKRRLADLLRNHVAQRGRIQDDTEAFKRADTESSTERTKVLFLTYDFPQETYQKIKNTLQEWYNQGREFWYNFPLDESGIPEGQYNCVTFLTLLGIPVPCKTGYIHELIAVMDKEEAPQWKP